MGLNFEIQDQEENEDHDWTNYPRWSYGSFRNFRLDLAHVAFITQSTTKRKDDPIDILLDHSDCDGEISAEDCAKIAPRLRELIPRLSSDYDRLHAVRLADLMDICAQKNKLLIFC